MKRSSAREPFRCRNRAGVHFGGRTVCREPGVESGNQSRVAANKISWSYRRPDATEIVQAWSAGADLVKVFPAGAMGGASYIKSLKARSADRIGADWRRHAATAASFIEAGAAGSESAPISWIIKAIRSGHPEKVPRLLALTSKAVRMARGADQEEALSSK